MARRNDHTREELRRMSLEAAENILAHEGVGALSVRRIAHSIGYTHGTLYLLFQNLDGLLLEVNARSVQELAQCLERVAQTTAPGVKCLHALAVAYVQFARTHNARWRLVFEHRMPNAQSTPQWLGERIARAYAVLNNALTAAGAAADEIAELSAALFAAIHGVTILALDDKLVNQHGESLDFRPILDRTVQVFCTTLKQPSRR